MSDKTKNRSGGKNAKTLTDDAIVTNPKIRRRGLLAVVGHGVVGAAAVATGLVSTPSHALTDNDTGAYADPIRQGRGSGVTDGDLGRSADPVNGGRNTGVTDSDVGRSADPPGNGRQLHRRRSDPADADGGRYADPADTD